MSGGPEKAETTEQQKALGSIAAQQYNNYMSNYRPFETHYIEDVTGDTSSRTAKVQGRSSADVAQAGGSAIKPGVDPTSGKAFSEVSNSALPTAKSKALVQGRQAVDNQQINAEQGIVNMGQGKAATTQAGMSTLASNAAGSAINDARLRVSNDAFVSNTAGSAVGLAAYGAKGVDWSGFGMRGTGDVPAYTGKGAGGDLDSGNFDALGNRIGGTQ